MKKIFYLAFFSFHFLTAQEKSKVLYRNEVVYLTNKSKLEIESFIEEQREIAKSKNVREYSINIPYDNFSEISNIKGMAINPLTNKKNKLSQYDISTNELKSRDVFYSDNKYKHFDFSYVVDKSRIEFSYKVKQNEPRLLSYFAFQQELQTVASKFEIKSDPSIEVGYKLFGENQDKIVFEKTKEGNIDVYTWKVADMPAFEEENRAPNYTYFLPHIVYYIKSYTKENKKEELLPDVKHLYKWYYSLVKDVNKLDQAALKSKTLELIKDKTNPKDQAKEIYNWVQQNIHYVAFEYEMGGFIPRDAASVFDKKYGDCKDISNLLNEMFKHAGIESNLVWIGTRDKPYRFEDVPTPLVSNHMIASVKIDKQRYFVDGTDSFCPFGFPSSMTQGKEGLIGISEDEFVIEKVPVVDKKDNRLKMEMKLKIADNAVSGTSKLFLTGYEKSNFLNILSANKPEEDEILKNGMARYNEKLEIETTEVKKNEYENKDTELSYSLKLDGWVKKIGDKIIMKPILLAPFKEYIIDLKERKLPIENDIAFLNEFTYVYEIPENYQLEFVPENSKKENENLSYEIAYKKDKKNLIVSQKIALKKLRIETSEFESWNTVINELTQQYNQSIILSKK
ncbi:DUF3857 domain-containing protein [Flavobacterium circumlabens]|uniref:DUF3857 domain-containing protein n=1 Tax=Flavobacterium circumlabens TaxID=2133765 RepID=A0A4Y7UKU4_9FLAO|nr:DUF3857 domain-containing protein [Flavobacterium circumlabens]TCN61196.1 transglutaminase-like putative cysteine protease [Flavobacterium circumlabens]TEB46298.1 DUF3857 domain-containing protein [Flavobacterium circumlabens]